jgi:dinuclear metal center YbgI/SA1388 family protein
MSSVDRNKIVGFCEEYLKVKDFHDYCVNGLQVEGVESVEKIVTGVSLSKKLIEAAIAKKAQMLLVHHGIFKDLIGDPPTVKGYIKNRLKLILENNISLLGFHLPLDAHPIIGNNICLCRLLGVKNTKPLDVGYIGELSGTKDFKILVKEVDKKLNVKSFALAFGPKKIKKIAIISGGASPDFEIAKEAGADVFICGDMREQIPSASEEVGISIINAGHYNTEKLGIENLGKLIAKKFKVSAEFVDVPNEI